MRLDFIFTMRYIYTSILAELTRKIQQQSQKHQIKKYRPLETLSNGQEDHPSLHNNSHRLYSEKGV